MEGAFFSIVILHLPQRQIAKRVIEMNYRGIFMRWRGNSKSGINQVNVKEDWWKERQKRQEENRLEEQKEQQDQRTALQPELVHMSGNMFFLCVLGIFLRMQQLEREIQQRASRGVYQDSTYDERHKEHQRQEEQRQQEEQQWRREEERRQQEEQRRREEEQRQQEEQQRKEEERRQHEEQQRREEEWDSHNKQQHCPQVSV